MIEKSLDSIKLKREDVNKKKIAADPLPPPVYGPVRN